MSHLHGATPQTDALPNRSQAQDQQLVARIKRSSKYWGQTKPNAWFAVRVVDDYYHLRGNNNNYRLGDVVLGMRLANGAVVDFSKR